MKMVYYVLKRYTVNIQFNVYTVYLMQCDQSLVCQEVHSEMFLRPEGIAPAIKSLSGYRPDYLT